MSIYRVIDKLETYVREGTWLPFGMRILSQERLLEYIEKLRATLPDEVGRAKMISSNKDRVIRDAQQKAQQIVTEAATARTAIHPRRTPAAEAPSADGIASAPPRSIATQSTNTSTPIAGPCYPACQSNAR